MTSKYEYEIGTAKKTVETREDFTFAQAAAKALSTQSPKKVFEIRQVVVGSLTAHLVEKWKAGERL